MGTQIGKILSGKRLGINILAFFKVAPDATNKATVFFGHHPLPLISQSAFHKTSSIYLYFLIPKAIALRTFDLVHFRSYQVICHGFAFDDTEAAVSKSVDIL